MAVHGRVIPKHPLAIHVFVGGLGFLLAVQAAEKSFGCGDHAGDRLRGQGLSCGHQGTPSGPVQSWQYRSRSAERLIFSGSVERVRLAVNPS